MSSSIDKTFLTPSFLFFSDQGHFIGNARVVSGEVYWSGLNLTRVPDNSRLFFVIEREERRKALWEEILG